MFCSIKWLARSIQIKVGEEILRLRYNAYHRLELLQKDNVYQIKTMLRLYNFFTVLHSCKLCKNIVFMLKGIFMLYSYLCGNFWNFFLFLRWISFSHIHYAIFLYYPGLSKTILTNSPSEQQLARLADQLPYNSCRKLILHLGLEQKDWEDIETCYTGLTLIIKIMALHSWKIKRIKGKPKKSFGHLKDAMKAIGDERHLLCKVWTVVSIRGSHCNACVIDSVCFLFTFFF